MSKSSAAARRLAEVALGYKCHDTDGGLGGVACCAVCDAAANMQPELRRVAFHAWLRGFDYGVVDVPSMESGTARARDIDAILASDPDEGQRGDSEGG